MIITGRHIGAVVALLMLTSACNGDADEPAALPDITAPAETVSPTPSPTPTPTVEPPVEPADAHDYSAEGVEAFTRYAIDVINYAYQTNDVTYLEQIMTPDCQTCANTVDRLRELAATGGRVEGGQLILELISVIGPAEGVVTSAGVDVILTASRMYDAENSIVDSESDRLRQYIFDYIREGDLWKLNEIRPGADRDS